MVGRSAINKRFRSYFESIHRFDRNLIFPHLYSKSAESLSIDSRHLSQHKHSDSHECGLRQTRADRCTTKARSFLFLHSDTFGEAAPPGTGSQKRLEKKFLITQLWLVAVAKPSWRQPFFIPKSNLEFSSLDTHTNAIQSRA